MKAFSQSGKNQSTTKARSAGRVSRAQALRNSVCAAVAGLLVASPLWADDTEIFTGGSSGGIAPNVLLVVDVSSSMGWEVRGTGKNRLENMKDGLTTLLERMNNVNVALMSFDQNGGRVLFPMDNIDRNINESSGIVSVSTSIQSNNDDAQQFLDGAQEIVLDGRRLSMVELNDSDSTVYTRSVQDDDDDVEERASDGRMYRDSSDLEFVHDGGTRQIIGVRFAGTMVPAGATITGATITFERDTGETGNGTSEITITGQVGESRGFSNDRDDVSDRPRTDSEVQWDLNTEDNQLYYNTPDLRAIVQDIVDDGDWSGTGSGNSDMTFIFERRDGSSSSAKNVMDSRDGGFAPQLTVEYYEGATPSLRNTITGLRFASVDVPKGATITSAYIDFSASDVAGTSPATKLAILGENTGSADPFSNTDKILSRSFTSSLVGWNNPDRWEVEGETQTSPDVAAIVQEIVNHSDWCGGNAMALMVAGKGFRSAWARDAGNARQPVLRVEYDADSVVPGSSCAQASISRLVADGADDVAERGSNVWTGSNNHDFSQTNRYNGIRFTDLGIPRNAEITSAHIEFTAKRDYDASDTTSVRIAVEQTSNSAQFESRNGTVESRSWSSTVTWNIAEDWSQDEPVESTDITSLVQSVVNRGGWSVGNAMSFRVSRASGTSRSVRSYERNPIYAPRLVVKFKDDGTTVENTKLVREVIQKKVDELRVGSGTPIQGAIYEAAMYYTGGEVLNGVVRPASVEGALEPGTYVPVYDGTCSDDERATGSCKLSDVRNNGGTKPRYKSPIVDFCQRENHIIMLTDGEPSRSGPSGKMRDFIGVNQCDSNGVPSRGQCVTDIARFMNTVDQSPLPQTQSITTHTVGFNFSSEWYKRIADEGGGDFVEASNADELVESIESILAGVLKVNSTFVAPVAAINQFNRLNHRSEIYFAVFRPNEQPGWTGNLKKYRLGDQNEILDYSTTDGKPALDASTGFFSDEAKSAWGAVVDGAEVEVSGANSQLPAPASRKIYTYHSGSTSTTLTQDANRVETENTSLTKAMFGVGSMSDAEFDEHIEWILGKDVDDEDGNGITNEKRYIIADPLHSKPVAVTYGGTEEAPDITTFFGSNAGFLHAVDAGTGAERFAFMPEVSAPLQKTLREGDTSLSKVYGLDGSVSAWVEDANGDGAITTGTGDFVRLYIGQRRGGRNIYALDVTNRNSPELMWTIKGGTGDFTELGQTWSQPQRGTIDLNGTLTDVLFFAGGYDEDQDDTSLRAADDVGRAIYIVDAMTGALIWKGGPDASFTKTFADMKYSFPADLAILDTTGTGTDNMFFIGDVGGQVWRFDINNGAETAADLVSGGVIADLGVGTGTNSLAENRRFYHAADVALVVKNNQQKLAVAIGSGFRAGPLAKGTEDRFYVILQDNVFGKPASYTKLTTADLYDATDNDVGEGVDGAYVLLDEAQGYYFDTLYDGEKVLSKPLIFNNVVTFTTYEPNPAATGSSCIAAAGVTRVYQVNLLDGAPINTWDDVDGLSENDRAVELSTSSIIDEPVIICTGGGCDLFVGPEKPPSDILTADRVYKTFWRKE